MKKQSLAATATSVLFTGTASGADMVVRTGPAPIPVAVFTSATILEARIQATIALMPASVLAANVTDTTCAPSTQWCLHCVGDLETLR